MLINISWYLMVTVRIVYYSLELKSSFPFQSYGLEWRQFRKEFH